MTRIFLACLLLATSLASGIANSRAESEPAPFEDVLAYVSQSQHGLGGRPETRPQVYCRLLGADQQLDYTNPSADRDKWQRVLTDERANIYARMCAAQYIAATSEEARNFLERQLASPNLRHRYNAAEAVLWHIGMDHDNKWGIDILLQHTTAGHFDGVYTHGKTTSADSSVGKAYPDGDQSDHKFSPLDDICTHLGLLRCQRALPVLMGVLERKPGQMSAAYALGQIGDPKAIPSLIKSLQAQPAHADLSRLIASLAYLKATEAVPHLLRHLNAPGTDPNGLPHTGQLLDTLRTLGGKQAIGGIRTYLTSHPDSPWQTTAQRVLVELEAADPVAELITRYQAAQKEEDQEEWLLALLRYPEDPRVCRVLATTAGNSEYYFLRMAAIDGLGQINSRESLLALANLLDHRFPDNLKGSSILRVGRSKPELEFARRIHESLKLLTGKDLPPDAAVWKKELAIYEPKQE